jgi:methylated-DNA-[protein]-cysteine S-methyltransferase
VADDAALRHLGFPKQGKPEKPEAGWTESAPRGILAEAAKQLREYFAGRRTEFDLPLAQPGTTFQQSVWRSLSEIPYGETISYAELAKRVGNPKAARAVGSANGKNQLAIVIPCHRVIAADGTLGGFGAGLSMKTKLLNLERQR